MGSCGTHQESRRGLTRWWTYPKPTTPWDSYYEEERGRAREPLPIRLPHPSVTAMRQAAFRRLSVATRICPLAANRIGRLVNTLRGERGPGAPIDTASAECRRADALRAERQALKSGAISRHGWLTTRPTSHHGRENTLQMARHAPNDEEERRSQSRPFRGSSTNGQLIHRTNSRELGPSAVKCTELPRGPP